MNGAVLFLSIRRCQTKLRGGWKMPFSHFCRRPHRGLCLFLALQPRFATTEAFVLSGSATVWNPGGPTRAASDPSYVGAYACFSHPNPDSRQRKLSFCRGQPPPGAPAARPGPPLILPPSGHMLVSRTPTPIRDNGSFRSVGVSRLLEPQRPDLGEITSKSRNSS